MGGPAAWLGARGKPCDLGWEIACCQVTEGAAGVAEAAAVEVLGAGGASGAGGILADWEGGAVGAFAAGHHQGAEEGGDA